MYNNFAYIYDRLMQDIPYEGWIRYLHRMFEIHGIQPVNILDLGCGTGNVTIPLAEMGYRLVGLDISADMLSVAEAKARSKGLKIEWIQQDMRQADLGGRKFDLVISMTDSLNYMKTPDELAGVFRRAGDFLKPGGWLIFDLNSLFKLSKVFGNNVFTYMEEDLAYIWENEYNPDNRTCHMNLTFFVREQDGKFRRFTEYHHETAYTAEEVENLLVKAGFTPAAVYEEGSFEKPSPTAERLYFAARKNEAGR